MSLSIEEKFKKLSEIDHVLLRPGRYLGSVTRHTEVEFVVSSDGKKFEQREVTYTPAMLKLFDEIISNSVDHSKRPEGVHLDTIRVEVNTEAGTVMVYDNGGIPVLKHKEYDQWVPEMIFELRAGSNFNDDDNAELTGQNGEGAGLTAIFSKEFVVETCDSVNRFKTTFSNNFRERTEPKIQPAGAYRGFTRITYTPDLEKLNATLDGDNLEMLKKRTYDIAGLNPHLKVYWNGERIGIRTFKDYVTMYTGDEEIAIEETPKWNIAVASSPDGFRHFSFVNDTRTKEGGTHIMYVGMQIWESIRAHIKKRHKVDVKPAELRQHMTLFIDAAIVNPRYSSQTKENLITEPRDYGTSYVASDKFIRKILSSTIIQDILDWAAAKAAQEEMKELRKLNKESSKNNLRSIAKFTDATSKEHRENCALFLCEGDSASNAILSARTPMIGCYPLRGKPLNAMAASVKDIMENKEFVEFMTIMGLKIGEPVKDIKDLRFGRVVACCDADPDGFHITGLLIASIKKYWPELLSMGIFYRFKTPIMKVMTGKEELFFYSLNEFKTWSESNKNKKFTTRYLKGIGSSTAKDFKTYFDNMDKHLVKLTIDDDTDYDIIDLVFGKEQGASDRRKEWLALADEV